LSQRLDDLRYERNVIFSATDLQAVRARVDRDIQRALLVRTENGRCDFGFAQDVAAAPVVFLTTYIAPDRWTRSVLARVAIGKARQHLGGLTSIPRSAR
jgi:hypothetical protein